MPVTPSLGRKPTGYTSIRVVLPQLLLPIVSGILIHIRDGLLPLFVVPALPAYLRGQLQQIPPTTFSLAYLRASPMRDISSLQRRKLSSTRMYKNTCNKRVVDESKYLANHFSGPPARGNGTVPD